MKRGGQGGSPHAPATPLGFPPPPIKGAPLLTCLSHLLVKDLSPPLEFIPHGLGLARYMFPVAIRQERVVLPLHRWSEEAEVARCLERVCEHGCAADLRRQDFLSILRSARDRLHQPRVELVKLCRSSRVCSLRIYIRPLFVSSRQILVHSCSHRRKFFVFYAANPTVVSEPDLCVDTLHGQYTYEYVGDDDHFIASQLYFGYWWHSGMKRPGQTLHVLAHETCSTLDMQLVCISGQRVSVSPTIVNI